MKYILKIVNRNQLLRAKIIKIFGFYATLKMPFIKISSQLCVFLINEPCKIHFTLKYIDNH